MRIEAQVTGIVVDVSIAIGETVKVGDTLMVIESMKMHYPLDALMAGDVTEILVEPKDTVEEGQVVIVLDGER